MPRVVRSDSVLSAFDSEARASGVVVGVPVLTAVVTNGVEVAVAEVWLSRNWEF